MIINGVFIRCLFIKIFIKIDKLNQKSKDRIYVKQKIRYKRINYIIEKY